MHYKFGYIYHSYVICSVNIVKTVKSARDNLELA